MARTIQIPIAIQFETRPARWIAHEAEIIGWWVEDDGTPSDMYLAAALGGESKQKVPLYWGDLPSDLAASCSKEIDVAKLCAGFAPQVLVNTWKGAEKARSADPWQMREDFLKIKPDVAGVHGFLQEWGWWNNSHYVWIDHVLRSHREFRKALTSPRESRFKTGFDLPLGELLSARFPYLSFKTWRCEGAIRLTIAADFLRGIAFKVCGRRDCATPYAVTTRHRRKYCSQYCGHLESVRRQRKEEGTAPRRGSRFQEIGSMKKHVDGVHMRKKG